MKLQQLKEFNVGSLEVAQRRLLKKMTSLGFEITNITPINQNRYMVIKGFQDRIPKNILLMFKRDFFHNFGIEFRHLGLSGLGETVNVLDLQTALSIGVTHIYTIYPTGICYSIKLMDFLEKSVRWVNKEGKEVRSISIHELKRECDLRK